MIQYVHVNATDRTTQELDDNISKVFESLYSNPLLKNPVIVKSQVFTSGVDLIVSHKLNKVVTGYLVINSNAAVSVYKSSTTNIAPTAQIILKSNANATVDILFF